MSPSGSVGHFMYGQIINIDETLKELCGAISTAETAVKEQIKLYYHNVNEEFITTLLYSHIKHRLREASQNKVIEKAFLEDLKTAVGYGVNLNWHLQMDLHRNAEGLIADMILHNRREEGKTGGDFGLVMIHPQITICDDSLEIRKGQTSGLLCQAKLKNKRSKWRFSSSQQVVLRKYLDFTSLVLYSYLDEERTDLDPLAWQSCRGLSLSEVMVLLEKGELEGSLRTTDIITQLGREEIGTEDQTLIDKVISPSRRQYFEIKIYWPKDKRPKEKLSIKIQKHQTAKEQVYVK